MEKDSKKQLKAEKEYLMKKFKLDAKKIQTEAVYGDCIFAIKSYVKNNDTYCIVMGTKGESGLLNKIIGSNTAYLIREVKSPLIAVPKNANLKKPKKITYASDLEPIPFAGEVLNPLLDILEANKAKLSILSVIKEESLVTDDGESTGDIKGKIPVILKKYPHKLFEIEDDSVEKGIHSYLENHPTDLLAMVTHDKNFFSNLFHPSMTKKIIISTHIPLLVMHEEVN